MACGQREIFISNEEHVPLKAGRMSRIDTRIHLQKLHHGII